MVGKRRFGLLMATVVLGLFVLWARLFQVQIVDHEVWAREAANLVRSASLLPYHRGAIQDRDGRVLAYDDDYYQIELDYRDFRRGHPLGQIAHARSSIEMRSVSLSEALESLESWAHELVELSPNQLAQFSPEYPIKIGGALFPPSEGLGTQRLRSRAGDAHYYAAALLLDDKTQARSRNKLRRTRGEPAGDLPFVDIVAGLTYTTRDVVLAKLDRRLRDARSDLGRLGAQLDCGKDEGLPPLEALVDDLEATRVNIEDAIADQLFKEATHFVPGRLSTESLLRIDSRWIAVVLAWDEVRLQEWQLSRREAWLAWAKTSGLYRGLLQIDLSYDVGDPAQRLLTELASLFAAEPTKPSLRTASDWRIVDELSCLSELPDLFDVPESARLMEERAFALPFQVQEVRDELRDPSDPWMALAAVLFDASQTDPGWTTDPEGLKAWIPPVSALSLAERWRDLSQNQNLHNERAMFLARFHFESLEAQLQEEIAARLDLLAGNAIDPGAVLPLSDERLTAAYKRVRHIVRDQSSRPAVLDRSPEYRVVQLVTRWHERFSGVEVHTRTRRLYPVVDEWGTPLASGLLGDVREANLREVLSSRDRSHELRTLQHKRERTPAEDQRVLALAAEAFHPEEHQGNSGLEGYLDDELCGENGYVETQGLEELRTSDGIELYQLPIDGSEIRLTLSAELQAAAQQVLERPILPASERKKDTVWFENPVGAIVMLTLEGDILAAASVPTRSAEAPPQRDGEREYVRERCFTRPRFQAPGSVFKPFVALWALENLDWKPEQLLTCAPLPGGGVGYETMHCHGTVGHGEIDMHDAIKESCNAYFAQLGETYTADELCFMADQFGFGKATGIRSLSDPRGGLREEPNFRGLEGLRTMSAKAVQARMKRQVGNGLSLVEATPGQVARAMCGLLTNKLPDLRLIDSIDGRVLPRKLKPLGFSGENLVAVQEALVSVVNVRGGTGYKGIGLAGLPFRVAGKTGSADYAAFKPGAGESSNNSANKKGRKHTWFAGWFPAEDPKAVFVIYLHDVSETSLYTSVHVARQFLQTQAVLSFVGAE